MTQVEQTITMLVILLGVVGSAVIVVAGAWLIIRIAVKIERLTRE